MKKLKIAVGSDHRGSAHQAAIVQILDGRGIQVVDCKLLVDGPADYPDAALAVGARVGDGRVDFGILICGSGIGMSIAANKVRGVRAALCFTAGQAETTRRHNDANVLCLSGDALTPEAMRPIVEAWLAASFEGGRHARRVQKIVDFENGITPGE